MSTEPAPPEGPVAEERIAALLAYCDEIDSKSAAISDDYSRWIEGQTDGAVLPSVPPLDTETVRRFLTLPAMCPRCGHPMSHHHHTSTPTACVCASCVFDDMDSDPPLAASTAQSVAADAGRAADAPGPYPSSAIPSDGA